MLLAKLLSIVPTIPLGILIVLAAAGLSILGLAVVRRLVPSRFRRAHHDLTNPILQVIALAYTVLLAFVVVVSWQNYDKANTHVENEANCLIDLHRSAAAFPPLFQDQLRAAIKGYADLVVSEDWPLMAKGEEGLDTRAALRRIWELYTGYEPKTEKEKAFFAQSISKLDDLREMRRLRIVEAHTGVHPVLAFVLILGGIVTVSFTLFFGAENFGAHAIMTAALTVLIALILFMIVLFDFPFSGSFRIEPEVFRQIIHF